MTTNIRRKTAVVAAALAVLGTGCAPSASAASDEYKAGYYDATHDDGLAYKLLAAGASAKSACRQSTLASNVDFPEMDIDDFVQGCLDGMEAQGWR